MQNLEPWNCTPSWKLDNPDVKQFLFHFRIRNLLSFSKWKGLQFALRLLDHECTCSYSTNLYSLKIPLIKCKMMSIQPVLMILFLPGLYEPPDLIPGKCGFCAELIFSERQSSEYIFKKPVDYPNPENYTCFIFTLLYDYKLTIFNIEPWPTTLHRSWTALKTRGKCYMSPHYFTFI